jgi:uncharacterized RDD family membrane protein YckC
VQYEDRISIATPEGVSVELVLAGVGSRFAAAFLDTIIQFTAVILLGVAAGALRNTIARAVATVGIFLVFLGYDIVFEAWNGGRTPGKMAGGLRVVRANGTPIGFFTSAVRNLLRLIDILPFFYIVGMITVLASSKNQRLGDLAAGTVIVRQRRGDSASSVDALVARRTLEGPEDSSGWDVSAVTADEISTVQRFLDRRASLTGGARVRLGNDLADRLRPKVVAPNADPRAERFLEELVAVKSARGF